MENVQDDQIVHIKGVIEILLFISEKPVTLEQLKKVLETVSGAEIKKVIKLLSDEYEENKRGMSIVEIAGGYQMLSNPLYVNYAKSFYKTKHKEKLSKPALETLAIIAYKQPVTRGEIELIRGVNSDGATLHLVNKELIKIVGRKDVPGKPYLYGTTRQFLEYFGLKSLDDLPKMEEFKVMAEKSQEGLPESTEKEGEESGQTEEFIPASEVPMNSLEQMKQNAIVEEKQQEKQGEATKESLKTSSDEQVGDSQEQFEDGVADEEQNIETALASESDETLEEEMFSVKASENENEPVVAAVMEQDEKEKENN